MVKLVLLCIGKLDIPYGVRRPFYIVCNSLIALAADADRELDCLACTDLFLPGRTGSR